MREREDIHVAMWIALCSTCTCSGPPPSPVVVVEAARGSSSVKQSVSQSVNTSCSQTREKRPKLCNIFFFVREGRSLAGGGDCKESV